MTSPSSSSCSPRHIAHSLQSHVRAGRDPFERDQLIPCGVFLQQVLALHRKQIHRGPGIHIVMVVIAMGKKHTLASELFEKLALFPPIYYLTPLIHTQPHHRMCQDLKTGQDIFKQQKQSVLTVYFFHLLPVISCQSCLAAALSLLSSPPAPYSDFFFLFFFFIFKQYLRFTVAALFQLCLFFPFAFFWHHHFFWQLSSIVNASMKKG